jgi:hypothetical protein
MKNRLFTLILGLLLVAGAVCAANPMDTKYTIKQCDGSLSPYPTDIKSVQYPDSLVPVFINHVGRHGSRYPVAATFSLKMSTALQHADSAGTITPLGREFNKLNNRVLEVCNNQWGALDSLGMAEQRSIATRMIQNFAPVFKDATVNALSSYSPRSMMSMFSFVNQLDRMNNHLTFYTSTGRINSNLMRPFDTSQDYADFRKDNVWQVVYNDYFNEACPTTALERILGKGYPYADKDEQLDLAINEYYVIAGLAAMSVDCDATHYFTIDEYNRLWSCFNLRQYLRYTATTLSPIPAAIAGDLLMNLIDTTQAFIDGTDQTAVRLRFGHAETLMPLLSLLHISGCYYLTNYFDTVAQHWRDFYVVPMAANLQMILFKSKKSGNYYIRVDLNEQPTQLIPNTDTIYTPWSEARQYMLRCLPLTE